MFEPVLVELSESGKMGVFLRHRPERRLPTTSLGWWPPGIDRSILRVTGSVIANPNGEPAAGVSASSRLQYLRVVAGELEHTPDGERTGHRESDHRPERRSTGLVEDDDSDRNSHHRVDDGETGDHEVRGS